MNGLRTARGTNRGSLHHVETQLADEASGSPPAPRGQRAGGPHAPEGITTTGQRIVIEGEFKGGEDLVIDGRVDGTIELPQQVLTVGPTGRVKAHLSAKAVVILGKVSGSIEPSELVRIGETGSVEGAVTASRLVVAVGARLQGRVDV